MRKEAENLKGRQVLVFGAGRSGVAASLLLLDCGARPVLYDGNEALKREAVFDQLRNTAEVFHFPGIGTGKKSLEEEISTIRIVAGALEDDLIRVCSLCVISPGVPVDIDPVKRIRSAGVPVWGEVELAYRLSEGEVLAVTGTNGKTTTVTLLGELMKRFRGSRNVFVVGNIGTPYTGAAASAGKDSVVVAEISSFQLETTQLFHPRVSVITNITPDHLNRHHTMEEYIRVKERIAQRQNADDVLILNYEDEVLRAFGLGIPEGGPRVVWFSSARVLEKGMYLEKGILKAADEKGVQEVIHTDELKILGIHNYENVCAAVLSAIAMHMPPEQIRQVLREFSGVEHRIEYVAEVDGVAYFNDSKGTNPDAAIKAVEAMRRPTVLIGGGYDKDSTYDAWIESFRGRVKALVLIGATKEKIAQCARKHGFENITLCETFEECFEVSAAAAEPGDAVLLSPACASWGMFKDYEERGRVFKKLVLERKAAGDKEKA